MCVCAYGPFRSMCHIVSGKPEEKVKGLQYVCVRGVGVATGIKSSLIMNTLIWYSREEKDEPLCINGVYFPSPLFLFIINSGCQCYLSFSQGEL